MGGKRKGEQSAGFNIEDLLEKLNLCVEAKPGKVDLATYIEAYDELYKLFKALGKLFGFVASDVKEKCDILRRFGKDPDHYATVDEMVDYEVATDIVRTNHVNGCRTLLLLHRAMPFASRFLTRVQRAQEDEPLRKHGKKAYDETLARYHPWVVRKAVGLAVYSLPTRRKLLTMIAGESAEGREHVAGLAPPVARRLDEIFEKVEVLYDRNKLHDLL